jgi:hypothetical protein
MNELTTSTAGAVPPEVSDTDVLDALAKLGVKTADPVALRAAKTVGSYFNQTGVAEVVLAQTFQTTDALNSALEEAGRILDNPDDMVKVRGVSSIAQLLKVRISNADLALKCAEQVGAGRPKPGRALVAPPAFQGATVNVHLPAPPEKHVADAS